MAGSEISCLTSALTVGGGRAYTVDPEQHVFEPNEATYKWSFFESIDKYYSSAQSGLVEPTGAEPWIQKKQDYGGVVIGGLTSSYTRVFCCAEGWCP